MSFIPSDIGAEIKAVAGVLPTSVVGTANGAAIDRQGFESCVLHVMNGAVSGSDTFTVDAKLQESADGSTGWTDITGAAVEQSTTDDNSLEVDVDLSGAKQYIRAVVESTVSGTDTLPVAASVILGGPQDMPA